MIVPRYYEDPHVLHENTMPNRSYYIPASKAMYTLIEQRNLSDRFQLLNGQWHFKYYDSIYNVQEEFFQTDYDVSGFDRIPVPGVWQNEGYDTHQYTNIRYPFPFDPPYVPQNNPCGAYVNDFTYHKCKEAPRAYLNFEGVDSCFYVWLNGSYIGYSQVSHSTSEFDVTDALTEGTNRIAVLVLKWCDGSYMEDQDKFRMSGIFRDVYILHRPEQMIFDYFIKTKYTDKLAAVNAEIHYLQNIVPARVSIYNKEGSLVGTQKITDSIEASGSVNVKFDIPDPILWNTEQPYLYTIVFETPDEVIVDRIGIREIYIEHNIVHFNGKPIV